MSLLERGFKSWAEKFAEGLRRELELDINDPMDLKKLVSFFGSKLLTSRKNFQDEPGTSNTTSKRRPVRLVSGHRLCWSEVRDYSQPTTFQWKAGE